MKNTMLSRIRHPLVTNSLYLYTAHFFDYLISIALLPFIAKTLGPIELGNVALAQTFGLFILIFMEFGFSLTATREVAKIKNNKTELNRFIGHAFKFKLLLIPIISIIAIFIMISFPIFQSKPHYFLIVLIGSIFQGLAPNWFFQGIEKLKLVAISKTVFRLISFILVLLFTNDEKDGWIILFGYTFTSLLIFIYLLKKLIDITGKIKFSNYSNFKSLWMTYRWLFLLTIIPVIYQNFSALILSNFTEPIKLGLYFGAAKIYIAFNSLFTPISQAFYPRLIFSNKNDSLKSKKLAFKLLLFLFLLGLTFCLLVVFLPKFFIITLLGQEYLESSKTLQLFGIVLPLTAISHVLGRQWMVVNGNEKSLTIITLGSTLIGLSFIIITINIFSINAIPISLIIYELFLIIFILIKK